MVKKTVEDICNYIIQNENAGIFNTEKVSVCRLQDIINFNVICSNPYESMFYTDKLYDPLVRKITLELACAIDDNSALKVKKLKEKYGELKEFVISKKILNEKCKEVWNVYTPLKNIPKDAMKMLGITNCPDLDFLLNDCIRTYEKDNSYTTKYAINAILKNKNIPYDMNDIHNYLQLMYKKYGVSYNFITVSYLISKHSYDYYKLKSIGVNFDTVKKAFKILNLKDKLKFIFSNLKIKKSAFIEQIRSNFNLAA